jgi:twitching motility two-component system response regulator PilH
VSNVQTVLIVDDSKTERELMSRAVTFAGFTPVFAEDGNEAVDKAKSLQPSLILMDVVMPNLNGFNATRQLKQDAATKHIPIVLVTTKTGDSDKFWGKKQGADDHVCKPFQSNELVDIIRRYVR